PPPSTAWPTAPGRTAAGTPWWWRPGRTRGSTWPPSPWTPCGPTAQRRPTATPTAVPGCTGLSRRKPCRSPSSGRTPAGEGQRRASTRRSAGRGSFTCQWAPPSAAPGGPTGPPGRRGTGRGLPPPCRRGALPGPPPRPHRRTGRRSAPPHRRRSGFSPRRSRNGHRLQKRFAPRSSPHPARDDQAVHIVAGDGVLPVVGEVNLRPLGVPSLVPSGGAVDGQVVPLEGKVLQVVDILLQAEVQLRHLGGMGDAHIAEVPGLVVDAGELRLGLVVADHPAIILAVLVD